ncbi:hypothetical protein MCBMB27_01871 [Methylobacterium phyllosphaerae]|uniref:Uncharacterized protein n=1 Tax=Methylobacterium phyllosphaerae TaxID=418223 RepID=A0AAE8L7E1_9HYPH|nr:hypothetical protein MCBMB27_01871 [Methylobacterium phyllosphaerae]KOX60343.1 hypothetical protein ADL19_01715 [Streptomyces purpurogeneiscleroticus]SFH12540.1 hypothetical protein SAMN05192567_114139 [Methylobacterium phyllosphaerae]
MAAGVRDGDVLNRRLSPAFAGGCGAGMPVRRLSARAAGPQASAHRAPPQEHRRRQPDPRPRPGPDIDTGDQPSRLVLFGTRIVSRGAGLDPQRQRPAAASS